MIYAYTRLIYQVSVYRTIGPLVFSKAVILVQFFMHFGVLGILCRFFTTYFILNHINVSFSILIWIREESSDFALLHVAVIMVFLFGGVSSSCWC